MADLQGEHLPPLLDALAALRRASEARRMFAPGTREYVKALETEAQLSRRIYHLANGQAPDVIDRRS
jgi:hypothetical protein